MYYGEEGKGATVALVCDGEQPRIRVDEGEAAISWSRWEEAWNKMEQLDGLCVAAQNCPPEPGTMVERSSSGEKTGHCSCARKELIRILEEVANDAGLALK
jgi:hypothetical protein